jgi:purine-binding chemotaxis protein CheW
MLSSKKIVVFKVDDENFAADIMQVERILSYTEPTKVPESPAYVKGVIKYQESILPVIDLKKRLNLLETAMKDDPKIIVVKHNEKSIGLIVDVVSEVIDISSDNIEPSPDIVRGISNKYMTGMIKLDGRIIILLDTQKILTNDEITQLNTVS